MGILSRLFGGSESEVAADLDPSGMVAARDRLIALAGILPTRRIWQQDAPGSVETWDPQLIDLAALHNRLAPPAAAVEARSYSGVHPLRHGISMKLPPASTPELRAQYVQLVNYALDIAQEEYVALPALRQKIAARETLLRDAKLAPASDADWLAMRAEKRERAAGLARAWESWNAGVEALTSAVSASEDLAREMKAKQALSEAEPYRASGVKLDVDGIAEQAVLNQEWADSLASKVDDLRPEPSPAAVGASVSSEPRGIVLRRPRPRRDTWGY